MRKSFDKPLPDIDNSASFIMKPFAQRRLRSIATRENSNYIREGLEITCKKLAIRAQNSKSSIRLK